MPDPSQHLVAYHAGRTLGATGAMVVGLAEFVAGLGGGIGGPGTGPVAVPALSLAAAAVLHGAATAQKGLADAGKAGSDLVSQMAKEKGSGGGTSERPASDKPPGDTTPDGAGAKPPEGPDPAPSSASQSDGKVYRVAGDKTPSGKPYVGRTKQSSPECRGCRDGRDRAGAEIVDRYDSADPMSGKRAEQNAMNREGGLEALDNKRNEIREEAWAPNGIDPPAGK